jgi:hypothetical protein
MLFFLFANSTMSASPFQTYLSRSVDIFRRNTAKGG